MPTTPWLAPEIIVAFIGFAKALIWPIAIGIIVFIFFDDIRRLIPNIEEVGASGLKIRSGKAAEQANTPKETINDPLPENAFRQFGQERATEALRQMEASIRRAINTDVENGIITVADRLDWVIRHLAATKLERHFFVVYHFIFGSQIAALNAIKQTSVAPAPAIRQLFEDAKAKDPEFYGQYMFEEWVHFLTNQGLVVVEPGAIRITPGGEDFLTFMQYYKLPAFKRG